jgi:dUTP pyrophosphatase
MLEIPVLKVKKLFSDAKIPVRAEQTASGLDVYAYRFEKIFSKNQEVTTPLSSTSIVLGTNDRVLVHTGISATVGVGYEIQVRPRSGNSLNRGLIVVNSPGTIDEAYRGPICIIIANISHDAQKIDIGERIAQLVVCPVVLSNVLEVQELDETHRGSEGFGSTGK